MALYEPAQHLLKTNPAKGLHIIQSTTRLYINSGETIAHFKTESSGDNFIIYYEIKPDNEEQEGGLKKILEYIKYDGYDNPNHIVKINIIKFNEQYEMETHGSTSNNSDDADIDKKRADG